MLSRIKQKVEEGASKALKKRRGKKKGEMERATKPVAPETEEVAQGVEEESLDQVEIDELAAPDLGAGSSSKPTFDSFQDRGSKLTIVKGRENVDKLKKALENYRVEADPNFVFEKNRFSKDVFKIKYSGQQLIDQYPEVAD
ncbi:MAG: hypothetical protein F6K37_28560, partial [Moorea sp. SIO4E2]